MTINLAVIRGHLTAPPELRELPSGRDMAMLQITTRPAQGAISAPVVIWDPSDWVTVLDTGTELVVIGSVRRRFYRAGTTTASRVEIEASGIALASDKRRVAQLFRRVETALDPLRESAEA